jgi:hypothetical protein
MGMRGIRAAAIVAVLGAMAPFAFGTISIRLSVFPDQIVADSRSGTNITLDVRSNDGKIVPDGTRILLTTTLGVFRETIVTTQNGIARATLIAGNIPGIAKVTASEIGAATNPSIIEVEFVRTKEDLASASDYLEISTTGSLEFLYLQRIATSSALKQGVTATFQDIAVAASDLQYSYNNQVVRARDAKATINKKEYSISEFYYDLRTRKGYGLTQVEFYPVDRVGYQSGLFKLERYDEEEGFKPTQLRRRLGVVEITRKGVKLVTKPIDSKIFEFQRVRAGEIAVTESELQKERDEDIYTARITAKRMRVISKREIQFQNMSMYQGETRYLTQPLFSLNLLAAPGQAPTEQWVSVNNNQLAVNYPLYLSLEREQSRAFRFRTGQSVGRGVNVNRGVFLDYELNWNRSDRQVGNFTYTGVGRDDYNLGYRQFTRFDDRTSLNFLLDAPQVRSMLGSATLNRQEKNFQLSVTASAQRALKGTKYDRQDYLAVAEYNPVKLGKAPWQLFYGLNLSANSLRSGTVNTRSSGFGTRFRLQSEPFNLKGGNTLLAGATVTQLVGRNIPTQIGTAASLSLTTMPRRGFSNTMIYDYSQDGFTETALGRHRISSQLGFSRGNYDFSLFATKSLDVDRTSFFADASIRMAPQWRIANQYTVNRFAGDVFTDFNWVLAYRMRYDKPEFGLVYTKDAKRLGFVLLGISRS